MELRRVAVRVPATTANLGPGFDSLGMALGLWNLVRIDLMADGAPPSEVRIQGHGQDTLSRGSDNLVYRAVCELFRYAGQPCPNLRLSCRNMVPLGRGLGSSSAAVVGGLVAANRLCGDPLDRHGLLELAASMEGHPDNVAPALLGGCQVVVQDGNRLITSAVRLMPRLSLVVYIPDMPMPTHEARAVLPHEVGREEAIYNLGRVALLVNALQTGATELLQVATQDALHQPARRKVFPAMHGMIEAALAGGAFGAFLSGAGSSVVALARGREMSIGYEMADVARKFQIEGELKILRPARRGAYVVSTA